MKQSYSLHIKKISIIYHICIPQNWCLLCPFYINPDEDFILRSLRSLTVLQLTHSTKGSWLGNVFF